MPETVNGIVFAILALVVLGGVIGVLVSRNVVYAAFWLLQVMLSFAGLFLLLSTEFIALVQVLVYAGAVSVVLLFVVMLTLRRREDAIRPRDGSVYAAILAVTFGAVVYVGLSTYTPPEAVMPDKVPGITEFGLLLFELDGGWVLPFEIASLVLLVALIAAVWWSGEADE